MRMLLKVTVPTVTGNKAINDGTLPRVIENALETLKPECAYFTAEAGKRTGFMVFDLKDPSQIPGICEPFFMGLEADISITPVMNVQDLRTGLGALAVKK